MSSVFQTVFKTQNRSQIGILYQHSPTNITCIYIVIKIILIQTFFSWKSSYWILNEYFETRRKNKLIFFAVICKFSFLKYLYTVKVKLAYPYPVLSRFKPFCLIWIWFIWFRRRWIQIRNFRAKVWFCERSKNCLNSQHMK